MQDPNADFKEIFDTIEAIPSAPKKLMDGIGRWFRWARGCSGGWGSAGGQAGDGALTSACASAPLARLPCSGADDPEWKKKK